MNSKELTQKIRQMERLEQDVKASIRSHKTKWTDLVAKLVSLQKVREELVKQKVHEMRYGLLTDTEDGISPFVSEEMQEQFSDVLKNICEGQRDLTVREKDDEIRQLRNDIGTARTHIECLEIQIEDLKELLRLGGLSPDAANTEGKPTLAEQAEKFAKDFPNYPDSYEPAQETMHAATDEGRAKEMHDMMD